MVLPMVKVESEGVGLRLCRARSRGFAGWSFLGFKPENPFKLRLKQDAASPFDGLGLTSRG